jgi:serine/threonine protein kinase
MTRDGKSVLSDFGLARMMTSTQRLTRLDMVVGTPEYMSPEQCASGDTGPASDQYSSSGRLRGRSPGTRPFTPRRRRR